ncbi:peptidase, partial [Desulfosporosinus sp. Tol-M]
MKKFWNWERDEDSGAGKIYLDGVIAEDSWIVNDITPKPFTAALA